MKLEKRDINAFFDWQESIMENLPQADLYWGDWFKKPWYGGTFAYLLSESEEYLCEIWLSGSLYDSRFQAGKIEFEYDIEFCRNEEIEALLKEFL